MANEETGGGTEGSPRARQAGPAAHATVQADVQQGPVPAGLREHLLQRGSDDARNRRGDGKRHVPGKNKGERGTDAPRALPLLPRPENLHTPKEWQAPAPPHTVLVR